MEKKKFKKKLLIIPIVLVVLLSAVLIYYFGASYPYYDSLKKIEFNIPGLDQSFVPQGFCYDDNSDTYLISGYMADQSPSRIYRVDGSDVKNQTFVTIKDDQTPHDGHVGGIAVYGDDVWVASSGKVFRINKNSLLSAQNGSAVATTDKFDPGNNASFITAYDGKLWVGEFYRKGNYETDASHHLKLADDKYNRALALCFTIDPSSQYGIVSTTPTAGISLPDQVQGFDFTADGKVITSSSYSIPDSHIRIYKNAFKNDYQTQMTVSGVNIPVWVLSDVNLQKDISAPAMSEEIVVKDGRIFILYESACVKYRIANRTRTTNVHSLTIEN